jgi:hypothetical protein
MGECCPVFSGGKKMTERQQAVLWGVIMEEPTCPSYRVLMKVAERDEPLTISVRHVNRVRAQWGLSRRKGRPRGTPSEKTAALPAMVGKLTPHLAFIGVHLFAAWLAAQAVLGQVVMLLEKCITTYTATHPDEDFALLSHTRETLLLRFQALLYAPLLGIQKLSEYDVVEHPLATLVGRRYQSSTLNQFLGQLERIDAGEALLPALLMQETKLETSSHSPVYVDGHMIPFWTTRSLHKGKITMVGRIMAGSQAVIAHNQDGRAVFVAYHPPDIRLPRLIVEYCQQIAAVTRAEVFVIDREVNSVDLARCFEGEGIGLLSMLDKNEYDGLTSWEATPWGPLEDGSVLYEATWATPRPDDPRHFVLVETPERILAYWGTSKVKDAIALCDWPEVYRQRTEIQEHRFKEMKAHGALDVNFGTKLVWGPDRHQQRAQDRLEQSHLRIQVRLKKKQALLCEQHQKVAESQHKGHTTRLDQRQRKLQRLEHEVAQVTKKAEHVKQQVDALGEPKRRADRDTRKQLIMTIRTLLLENALLAFLAALCASMNGTISLDCLLRLVFKRSGSCLETPTEMLYWINTAGLSATYRARLTQVVQGLEKMKLRHQGKPIRVRLREAPT